MGNNCSASVPADRQAVRTDALLPSGTPRSDAAVKIHADPKTEKPVLASLTTSEIAARAVASTFFLLEAIAYTLSTLAVLFVPRMIGLGFPLYLPAELLGDPIAVDYFRVAVVAVCMIGLGYIPVAMNSRAEVMYASIFNKLALTLQAVVGYSLGHLPLAILVLVLIVDTGSMLLTLLMLAAYPSSIPKERRSLLWGVPSVPNRSARSYAFELEGYAMLAFYLALSVPAVGRAFASAQVERVGFTYAGVDSLEGYRLGMFSIATFWMANMYWFFIPAARTMATSVMSMARLQRIGLLAIWLSLHITSTDFEHNLFNTMALFASGFLAFDFYCEQYDKYFLASDKAAAASVEHKEVAKPAALSAETDVALYHQAELSDAANWVAVNAALLQLCSIVWMFLATSGLPFLFHKLLPGPEELGYKLHLQDFLIVTFIALLAVFLFPLVPNTPHGQLAVKATTFFMPWASWWFTTESKLLMHMNGGTPFHMSWVDLGLGTKFTELTTDMTFFGATFSLTVITPALLVLLALYFVGSPVTPFIALRKAKTVKEAAGPLRTMMVQQLVLLTAFTGGWMILVSSGLPMPTKFLTELAGIPALLPVDTRVAVQVHRYDLLGAMALVYVGVMLGDCPADRLGAVKVAAPLVVSAMWFYSVAVKVATNVGATPMFHQSWLDMYPLMSASSDVPRKLYTLPVADVLSWLAFVLLNFVALPFLLYAVWPNLSLSKMLATNPQLSKLTYVELMHYNRSMLFQHALAMFCTSGLWLLLTSSGFVWPLESMARANVPPLLPSFDKPNPAALRVGFQDLLFANIFGTVAVFLDYVPIKLTGQRSTIVWTAQLSLWGTWALSIWNKVMVNMSEDDMLTWPGAGAFGEWRPPSERSTAHTFVDVIWYVTTIFGVVIAPLAIAYMLRNALADFSKSLQAHTRRVLSSQRDETDVLGLMFALVGRAFEKTQAFRVLAILSRVLSPPEQQYLTVDRIAYAMQEPSKILRRKHFKDVGMARDKFGWWYCSKVPDEIETFQRTQILPAMAAHTITKAPSTFFEIFRTRLAAAAPSWMVYTPLTDELLDDMFHSRFGAEILRKPTAKEASAMDRALLGLGKQAAKREGGDSRSAKEKLQGGKLLAMASKVDHRKEMTVCDLGVLTRGCERKAHLFFTPEAKLFFDATKRGIRCIAVEFEKPDGSVEMVVNDGTDEWMFAKRVAAGALITAHQIGVHLVHGHLLAESQVVLCYKYLDPTHWLFHWIEPLAGDVQFINETWGLEVILYGTIMDMGPMTSDGLMKVLDNAKGPAFQGELTWDLLKKLEPEHSGVPEHCPFNYRFTARIVQGIARNLATAVADKYFRADDENLAAFMKACYWWRPNPAAQPFTKQAVIDYMVQFFMNASYRHDYSHDDYLWHVTHALPTQLMSDPDIHKPSTYMPSKDVFGMALQIAHSLQAGVIETPLEAYYGAYGDTELRPAVDKFVADIQALLVMGGPHEHMNQCGSMTH